MLRCIQMQKIALHLKVSALLQCTQVVQFRCYGRIAGSHHRTDYAWQL